MQFKILPSEDSRFFEGANIREKATMTHQLLSRSAIQRSFEIVQIMQRKEKSAGRMTEEAFVALWQAEVKQGAGSELVSLNFVKNSVALQEKLLSNCEVRNVLLACEREMGKSSPFYNMSSLEAIMLKAKESSQVLWLVEMMRVYVSKKYMSAGQMTYRTLTGKNDGNRGTLDVFLLKRSLLQHFQQTWLDEAELPTEAKAHARMALQPLAADKFFSGQWRHAPGSVKVHLKYGRLTLHDVKKAVDSLDSGCVRKGASLKSWSTKSLAAWPHLRSAFQPTFGSK
ncbi:unnamed protein product [Effrenium voratum]|nr:unnamed protein product [Effrenium voratum]